MDRQNRIKLLKEHLSKRILVLDGAMGTQIQGHNLSTKDFGGPQYEGCNEHLNLTRPDVIANIQRNYLEAGADILETNTFGGTKIVLGEYQLENKSREINLAGAKLARTLADEFSTHNPDKPRWVAGSIGPTTKALSVTGGITFKELQSQFYHQAEVLMDGGVDFLLLETCQDTRNIKAGLTAFKKLFKDKNETIPVAVSVTIEPTGTMLAGQNIEALLCSLEHEDLLYIGINCSTGPGMMTSHVRTLATMGKFRVACAPNAGLPDENGHYLETPEILAQELKRFVSAGWINILGGCCGTGPEHIHAIVNMSQSFSPRIINSSSIAALSGIDYLEVGDKGRPYLVGERSNVIGSAKFKKLIRERKFEEASEVARAQVKGGANVVDVCLADPDGEELADMTAFLEIAVKKIRVPLMIDSTNAAVIEEALTWCQGKSIINSINLENGEERFDKIVPLAKTYGAALVVGTIDEDLVSGMAVTRERKLSIASHSYELLTKKFGIPPEDIYFDPLVFPVGTGDKKYLGAGVETIEGLRLIKKKFPKCKSAIGVSNVSFGLPPAGREVLNSVFLHHCTLAGLDMAIVNTEKLKRYSQITPEEIKLSEELIFTKDESALERFATFFREKKADVVKKDDLPLTERLSRYIIDGSKEGLAKDIEEALKTIIPVDIINGPLMRGMEEVGKLFNENKLIVAEVLQSAEAMKAAVTCLEPYMSKSASTVKGKMLLATVKGDVHDIGKNLVDIILTNNGFEVINLGIKITSEQLIQAARKHRPDMIGLSGLLVKSAEQMILTAGDLKAEGISVPLLVGGAALTKKFTDNKIAPAYGQAVHYARDAMMGLAIANKIIKGEHFENIPENKPATKNPPTSTQNFITIKILDHVPVAPDFDRHVIKNTPPQTVWNHINPIMLFSHHLGVKAKFVKLFDTPEGHRELSTTPEGKKALEILDKVNEVKEKFSKHFTTGAIYRFFPAGSQNNDVILFDPDSNEKEIARFTFPRQQTGNRLCLSDYLLPISGKRDSTCLFITTAGKDIAKVAAELKSKGEYLHSHILSALALESAEGYAEHLHEKIRALWGHTGKRYSFGYPACPNLSDQRLLFDLLAPSNDIGVTLTSGFMMEPEASVSAICFHHPQAEHFGI